MPQECRPHRVEKPPWRLARKRTHGVSFASWPGSARQPIINGMSDDEKPKGPWDTRETGNSLTDAAPISRRGDRAVLGVGAVGWIEAVKRWLRQPRA